MIKLCRDSYLIWPMEAVGGPNFYPINPTASQKDMCWRGDGKRGNGSENF